MIPAASSSPSSVSGEAPKPRLRTLISAVAIAIVVSNAVVCSVLYGLVRSGHLLQQSKPAVAEPAHTTITTNDISLEPLLVNLVGNDHAAYLRIAVTLRVADPVHPERGENKQVKKESSGVVKTHDAALQDTILAVLGQQRAEVLLAPDGKRLLKEELKTALEQQNPDIKITDIFFTDFLVQR